MLARSFRFLFTTSCPIRLEIPEIVSLLYIAKINSVRVAIEITNLKIERCRFTSNHANLLNWPITKMTSTA
jgi:hypothetical protein